MLRKLLLITSVLSFTFFSCSKHEKSSTSPDSEVSRKAQLISSAKALSTISFVDNEYTVPIEAAQAVAVNLDQIMPSAKLSKPGVALSIARTFTLKDSVGSPNMYVFDYNGGGFAIISADERYNPILAAVPQGRYEVAKDLGGVTNWFGEANDYINLAKKGQPDPKNDAPTRWMHLTDQISKLAGVTSARGATACTYPTYTDVFVGMTTTWGQNCGYNDSLTYSNIGGSVVLSCANCWNNNNPWTGCVATAMAQVIKFWQASTPQNYNYASMPNDNRIDDSTEVNRLMKDAGLAAKMDYGCGSSAAFLTDAQDAFYNNFGYRSCSRSSTGTSPINLPVLVSNITNGYPVILGGCTSATNPPNCHAWICDGYEKLVSSCYTYYYLHMNWGWDGYANGNWYQNDVWNSPAGTYSHHQKEMLYNILP